jgi:hypothetical protein
MSHGAYAGRGDRRSVARLTVERKSDTVATAELWKQVEWHSDAGHGWLKVPHELVEPVAHLVTSYSYRDAAYAYLEEDCDATRFIQHYESIGGVQDVNFYAFPDRHDGMNSPIRNKARF